MDYKQLYRDAILGRKFSADQAARCRRQLKQLPNDLLTRLRLIAYCLMHDPGNSEALNHIVWIIKHEPEAMSFRWFWFVSAQIIAAAQDAWLEEIQTPILATEALVNAGMFFQCHAKDHYAAETCILRAQAQAPHDPDISHMLSGIYEALPGRELDAFTHCEHAIEHEKHESRRFRILTELPRLAWAAGLADQTEHYAHLLLATAKQFKDNWNYGNAIFQAHTYLGKLALSRNNVLKAKGHLLKSARTTGSPQLNSTGPSMQLAEEILALGDSETVLKFIYLVAKFWQSDAIDRWRREIESGAPKLSDPIPLRLLLDSSLKE